MPTDILRRPPAAAGLPRQRPSGVNAGPKVVEIRLAKVVILATLADTETADRIWAALPFHTTAERWGEAVHFEVPVASGRDRTARLNARIGEIYYWPQERRIIIAFGPTPISSPGELRMPAPVNMLAVLIGDMGVLRDCRPGEKVIVSRRKT